MHITVVDGEIAKEGCVMNDRDLCGADLRPQRPGPGAGAVGGDRAVVIVDGAFTGGSAHALEEGEGGVAGVVRFEA